MIRLRTALVVALAGALSVAAARPLLQEGMEEMEMMMPQPTEEHAMLQKGVGTWEGTVTMYMPGMPETPSPAKEVVRSAGPFWTVSDFESNFMGMPYSGHGCHGYDPESGKFKSTWIDNYSSYLAIMDGEYDAETHTFVMTWEAPDMTGAMAPHRAVQKFEGENAYTMTFHTSGAKTMVISMKRKASAPGGSR